jgi:hypothetical protein
VDKTKSSAPAHPSTEEKQLAKLEERYRHELMDDEERHELRDRIQKAATPEEREMECPACGLVWHADGYDRGGGCEGTA